MEVPIIEPNVKVYVHLIRHAQTVTTSQKALKKAIRDPLLTLHGQNEALDLLHRFPHQQKLTHIITSPLRRTLQTTIIALEPAIRSGIRPIAMAELREVGNGPNSTGSEISLALRDWGELGDFIPSLMKELWDWYGLQLVKEGKDVHIAVVSHGVFLWKMTGEELGDYFGNAEFRTYGFRGEEDGLKENQKSWDLVEIQESLDRPHPSTSEEDLAKRALKREQANAMDVKNAGAGVLVTGHVEDAMILPDTAVLDPRLFL
ncbi:hypothetical protein BKA64DRAFT_769434 [Cadophora sp. MPI-SDFR-AT-0126]|nr:hypothetical protein BKA64DRAFT_769434 [Leotiomycetes sp. MPI-SDFR-AT-0126]